MAARGTVLAAHPSPDQYGADLQLLEAVRALVEDGWRVVVTLPGPGPLVSRLVDAGAEVGFLSYPVLRKAQLRPLALVRLVLAALVCLPALVRLVLRQRPSVLLVNTVTLPWWLLAGWLTRTPTIAYVHEAETALPRPVRRLLLAPLLLAQAVIVISEVVRAAATAVQPRLASRCTLIYNGVAGPPETGAPPAWHRPVRLSVVGRLSPRKAPHLALEAVRRLAGRHDVVLEVAGTPFEGYEWYEGELRAAAETSDLAGRVTFSGYCSPVWPVLQRADIVLAPSVQEPFGNVVVEAQLAGRPVVAAAAYGHLESVVNGETGLLVPPGDATALADGVARLLADPALAQRLADRGRAEAERRFAVDRYRRELVALVDRTAG